MRLLLQVCLIAAFACCPVQSKSDGMVSSIRELNGKYAQGFADNTPFSFTGTVVRVLYGRRIVMDDGTGRVCINNGGNTSPVSGDLVQISGLAGNSEWRYLFTGTNSFRILSRQPPPSATDIPLGELASSAAEFSVVRTSGRVTDAFRDDIDPSWAVVLLADGSSTLTVVMPLVGQMDRRLDRLIDSVVSVEGVYECYQSGRRQYLGPHLELTGAPDDLKVLMPPPDDPYAVEAVGFPIRLTPLAISTLGRRQATGRVLATWLPANALLQTADDAIVGVTFANGETLPDCGKTVTVSGYPATDLYRINLTRAQFKAAPALPLPERPAERIASVNDILLSDGFTYPKTEYHGRPVTICGLVRSLSRDRFVIEADGGVLEIDASTHPGAIDGLRLGTLAEISGIWLFKSRNWSAETPLPKIDGVAIVLRSAADVRILKMPSRWTPVFFMAVIAALLLLLAVSVVGNWLLNRLVERRGRALYREQLATASATMRTAERTRLAVELHDSLSQTLTGVSFQIDAAEDALLQKPQLVGKYLARARTTLHSCRKELRNCLWDLRNRALEEKDAAKAIRLTLAPHAKGAQISTFFPIPRSHLSDTAFHALLRIFRELTVNAISHGHATRISVRGDVDGDDLVFSVSDNGSGFVPEARQGADEGHFGLQGVSERVASLDGSIEIVSAPGKGATVKGRIKSWQKKSP